MEIPIPRAIEYGSKMRLHSHTSERQGTPKKRNKGRPSHERGRKKSSTKAIVTVLDRFRSYDDMRFRIISRGRYGPSSICGLLPLLSFRRSYVLSLVIALDLGNKSISLPSTYLGDLLPNVKSTRYLSGTRASACLDSVGLWPDLRLVLCCSLLFAY